jgi:hypothetical protein
MKATNCRFFRFFGKKYARYASDPKSPVRKIRTPGSVAGLVSNRQSYADVAIKWYIELIAAGEKTNRAALF